MELIDRAAAIAAIKSYCANCDNYGGMRCRSCGYMDAMDKVDEVPTVDAVPMDYPARSWQLIGEERIEFMKAVAEKNVAVTKGISPQQVAVAKMETTIRRAYWKPVYESEITGYDPELSGRDPVGDYECSACGKGCILDCDGNLMTTNYCPHCGAKMDNGEDINVPTNGGAEK